jgi:hypothetical protein
MIGAPDAEEALKQFVSEQFNATNYQISGKQIYSKLLFQRAKSLSDIHQGSPVPYVEVSSETYFEISKQNINQYLGYQGRQSIRPDSIHKKNDAETYYLGEAKGTKDLTGTSGGSTYSCAHKISTALTSPISRQETRYARSFLSQPLGYIDGLINYLNNKSVDFKLYFVWLVCDENSAVQYSGFGPSLTQEIDKLFPSAMYALLFKNYYRKGSFHYFVFEIDRAKARFICDRMATEFIKRYLL